MSALRCTRRSSQSLPLASPPLQRWSSAYRISGWSSLLLILLAVFISHLFIIIIKKPDQLFSARVPRDTDVPAHFHAPDFREPLFVCIDCVSLPCHSMAPSSDNHNDCGESGHCFWSKFVPVGFIAPHNLYFSLSHMISPGTILSTLQTGRSYAFS